MKLKTVDLHSFVATAGNDESGDLTSQNQRSEGFTSELLTMIGLLGKKSGFL